MNVTPGKDTLRVGGTGSATSLASECPQGSAADSSKHNRIEGFCEPVWVCAVVCIYFFPHIENLVHKHCYRGGGQL